jgi:hypothetical protein
MSDVGYVRIEPGAGEPPPCDQAKGKLTLIDGMWQCAACALAWDDGDAKPPCRPLTYARLIEGAMDEAVRIESAQAALVAAGDRQFRHQGQLRRAQELRALVRLAVKTREERGARE